MAGFLSGGSTPTTVPCACAARCPVLTSYILVDGWLWVALLMLGFLPSLPSTLTTVQPRSPSLPLFALKASGPSGLLPAHISQQIEPLRLSLRGGKGRRPASDDFEMAFEHEGLEEQADHEEDMGRAAPWSDEDGSQFEDAYLNQDANKVDGDGMWASERVLRNKPKNRKKIDVAALRNQTADGE
eukprot:1247339-Rhodomonas_salina.1